MNFRQRHTISGLIFGLMLLLPGGSLFGQQQMVVQEDKSNLWIEGSSNVNTFSCQAERYNATAYRLNQVETQYNNSEQARDSNLRIELNVDVNGFECGRSRMNRDLKEALKAEEYSYIEFEFRSADSIDYRQESDIYVVTVTGNLTVAGVTNEITFEIDGYLLENGNIRGRGMKEINMLDYDVDPPKAMLGIVRVDEILTVHFDLTASITES